MPPWRQSWPQSLSATAIYTLELPFPEAIRLSSVRRISPSTLKATTTAYPAAGTFGELVSDSTAVTLAQDPACIGSEYRLGTRGRQVLGDMTYEETLEFKVLDDALPTTAEGLRGWSCLTSTSMRDPSPKAARAQPRSNLSYCERSVQ